MKKDTSAHRSSKSKDGQLDQSAKTQAKKISLGKLVQKTVEVLKKPFSKNQKLETKSKSKSECPSTPAENPSTIKKRKPKHEQIAVDYPTLKVLDDASEDFRPKKRKQPSLKDSANTKSKGPERKRPLSKKQKQLLEQQDMFGSSDRDEQYSSDSMGDGGSSIANVSGEVNGFFYTNDKFLDRIEDREILKYIRAKYPKFMQAPEDLQTSKKAIIEMLGDSQFMEDILKHYDMNIYDFFKFLFRLEPDWFKGSFLKRVQKAMKYKKYATAAKRTSYVERKRARLKQLRKAGYCISRPKKASQVPTTGLQWKSRAH